MENRKITAHDLQFYGGLKCLIYDGGEPVSDTIEGIDLHLNKVISERANYDPIQIKPILKQLENITLEEVVYIVCDIMGCDRKEDLFNEWYKEALFDINQFGYFQFAKSDSIWTAPVAMYLLKQGYNLHLLPHGSYVEIDKEGKIIKY